MQIFLSYAAEDSEWADNISDLLSAEGLTVCKPWSPPANADEWLQKIAENATHTLVLVGNSTRLSKWVNREIEISTEYRKDGPGAGLIGILLPTLESFSTPYYEPEDVPLRLHDLVLSDYALIRKWSDDAKDIRLWLDEAEKRRFNYRPEPSMATAAQLYRFSWSSDVDATRGPLT